MKNLNEYLNEGLLNEGTMKPGKLVWMEVNRGDNGSMTEITFKADSGYDIIEQMAEHIGEHFDIAFHNWDGHDWFCDHVSGSKFSIDPSISQSAQDKIKKQAFESFIDFINYSGECEDWRPAYIKWNNKVYVDYLEGMSPKKYFKEYFEDDFNFGASFDSERWN